MRLNIWKGFYIMHSEPNWHKLPKKVSLYETVYNPGAAHLIRSQTLFEGFKRTTWSNFVRMLLFLLSLYIFFGLLIRLGISYLFIIIIPLSWISAASGLINAQLLPRLVKPPCAAFLIAAWHGRLRADEWNRSQNNDTLTVPVRRVTCDSGARAGNRFWIQSSTTAQWKSEHF